MHITPPGLRDIEMELDEQKVEAEYALLRAMRLEDRDTAAERLSICERMRERLDDVVEALQEENSVLEDELAAARKELALFHEGHCAFVEGVGVCNCSPAPTRERLREFFVKWAKELGFPLPEESHQEADIIPIHAAGTPGI
jgi:hypothetical protein